MKIKKISACEILDSRGNPTVCACVYLNSKVGGCASVPSGASVGKYEALELRDKDPKRYNGKGVLTAVENIEKEIAPQLIGFNIFDQQGIDKTLIAIDGTKNKKKLGANSILAVSLACVCAGAKARQIPLYKYLAELFFEKNKKEFLLPIPRFNILNGGMHAQLSVDIQEYMIIPMKAISFSQALRIGCEVYYCLKELILQKGQIAAVGDEGGFVPKLDTNEEPFKLIVEAIGKAGYEEGKDVGIGIDAAASTFLNFKSYFLKKEKQSFSNIELLNLYKQWINKYPLISIEDGFAEDDWQGFETMIKALGKRIEVVGDDLYVTNITRLEQGIKKAASNAIIIKPNQIGTLTETVEAIKTARRAGWHVIVSSRSGETEDTTLADLAVAFDCGFIKTGAPARSERVAKYNRLLWIEHELGDKASYKSFEPSFSS